jgi:hypothetical protein
MARALPWLLLLALVAGAAWLLFAKGSPEEPVDLRPEGAPSGAPAPEGGGLRLAPPPGTPTPKERPSPDGPRAPVIIDPRTIPVGPIAVDVLGPDDQRVPHEEINVSVTAGKGSKAWHAAPLLVPDPQTGIWAAPNVFVGPVRVSVFGETILPRDVETNVTSTAHEPLRIHVDRAGRLEYVVKTFGGEPLEEVTVTLLGASGKPQRVYYQVRTSTVVTQPRLATEARQGPEGLVYSIPPGSYRLRVTSPAGEWEEAQVEVKPLSSEKVELTVRR